MHFDLTICFQFSVASNVRCIFLGKAEKSDRATTCVTQWLLYYNVVFLPKCLEFAMTSELVLQFPQTVRQHLQQKPNNVATKAHKNGSNMNKNKSSIMRVNTNSFGMYPTEELTLEGKENIYYVESIIDRKEETDENLITRIRRRLFHTCLLYTSRCV